LVKDGNCCLERSRPDRLFVFMSVFSQFFLAFMGSDFSQFALSSAGHLNSPKKRILTAQAALSHYAGMT